MRTSTVTLILLALAFSSAASQDIGPAEANARYDVGAVLNPPAHRALGDLNWYLELQPVTGGSQHQGVEFDGANYWVSGSNATGQPCLFVISPSGDLLHTYVQGTALWSYRDLAFDGQFLYAGDGTHPGYVAQIDPTSGQLTGLLYGPYPLSPCRAMAYQGSNDSFWTASFTSDLYHVFKDGSYAVYPNPALSMYGAAVEELNPQAPTLWWWSQDGTGGFASEYDPNTGGFTGRSFQNPMPAAGVAGGCGAYARADGGWEMACLLQGGPDYLLGVELDPAREALSAYPAMLDAPEGGPITFYLNAGPSHAGRKFGLFGTASGTEPGLPLPGGLATLPIHWDLLSELLLTLALSGHPSVPFVGSLDGQGKAQVVFTVPSIPITGFVSLDFALCLAQPFDFASNPVRVDLFGLPANTYAYDDGVPDGSVLLSEHAVWVHALDAGIGDVIESVSSTFGIEGGTQGPPNGTPCAVYAWSDPDQDGDPSDADLLAHQSGVVANTNSNIFNDYFFESPVLVEGSFFVGCHVNADSNYYEFALDSSPPYSGKAWILGGPTWDPQAPSGGVCYELGSIGFPAYWLLRANAD